MSSPSPSANLDQPVLPRLPAELLFEVLRNREWFDYSELAGFARVSRQWLEPARQSLYAETTLDLNCFLPRDNGNVIAPTSTRDQRMHSTLRESPHLAQLIKSVEITPRYNLRGAEATPGATMIESVVSEFFDLTTKLERIKISYGGRRDGAYETIFRKHGSRITSLDIDGSIDSRRLESIYDCFPNLQHFKTYSLPGILPFRRPRLLLSEVDLKDEGDTRVVTAFLDSSATSLRRLSLRLCVAAKLEYSKYPKLEYLHIHSDDGADNYDPTALRQREQHELWTRLSEAPSITTLSFDGETYVDEEEEKLFAFWGLGKQSPASVFTKIKRIEHRGGVKLDRIAALMQHAWLPEGVQIVVPWDPFVEEENRSRYAGTNLLQINALSAMCYTHDAELIYTINKFYQ